MELTQFFDYLLTHRIEIKQDQVTSQIILPEKNQNTVFVRTNLSLPKIKNSVVSSVFIDGVQFDKIEFFTEKFSEDDLQTFEFLMEDIYEKANLQSKIDNVKFFCRDLKNPITIPFHYNEKNNPDEVQKLARFASKEPWCRVKLTKPSISAKIGTEILAIPL